MSYELDLPFLPNNTNSMRDIAELFSYIQQWSRDNNLGTNLVAFKAYSSAVQSINNLTDTKVILDIEVYDYSSNFDSDTNYRFVSPYDGTYNLIGSVGVGSLGDAKFVKSIFYKNGASFVRGTQVPGGVAGTSRSIVSAQVYLNKNDYIELYVHHDHGSARNTQTGEDDTFFGGFFVR